MESAILEKRQWRTPLAHRCPSTPLSRWATAVRLHRQAHQARYACARDSCVDVFHAAMLFAETLAGREVARYFRTQPSATMMENPKRSGTGVGQKYTAHAERRTRDPQKILNSSFYGFNVNKPGGDEHVYVMAYPDDFMAKAQTMMAPKRLGFLASPKKKTRGTCVHCKKSRARGGLKSQFKGSCCKCLPEELKSKLRLVTYPPIRKTNTN